MNFSNVKIKFLRESARIPVRGSRYAAAFDVHFASEDGGAVEVDPGQVRMIPTGLAFELPVDVAMLVMPRSGMASKMKLRPANTPGLVDPDYRGELFVAMENFGEDRQVIKHGDRIAQIMFTEFKTPLFQLVEELGDTERGSGGFGSTGV